jgi:sugar (pentulose or hexulose) kinase
MIAGSGASPEDVLKPPRIGERMLPDSNMTEAFNALKIRFRAAYEHLQEISSRRG